MALRVRVSFALRVERRLLVLLKVVVMRRDAAGSVLVHNNRAVSIYLVAGREEALQG